MEVKPALRHTEAGAIPEHWRVKTLSDLCVLQRGFDITESTRAPGNVPVYSSSGLSYLHNAARVRPPGVVTGRKGILGKVFYIEEPFWPHDTTLYVKDFKGNYPRYVYYYLQSLSLERFDAATSVPTLNRNNIHGLPTPIPPLHEQRAIADTLSGADALIGSVDRLIAKKRDIKQAAMQQLLTGRQRLPGFRAACSSPTSGKHNDLPMGWDAPTISQISRNIIDYRGRTPRKLGMDWGGGHIPALSARNVKMGYLDLEEDAHYGSDELYKRWMTNGDAQKDDIVVTMEAPLGNVALIPDNRKYILSQRTVLLQLDRDCNFGPFFIHAMLSQRFQALLAENASGSTATGIQRSKFETLRILRPPLPEQRAIANVLGDMDAEIAALEQRRDKTRALKQGMMQELLTGRTRLVDVPMREVVTDGVSTLEDRLTIVGEAAT